MQANDAFDNRLKGCGNLYFFGVRNETLVFIGVCMHLGGERILHLGHIATENDETPAVRDLIHDQPLALQPLLHLCNVLFVHSKPVAKLRWGEPLVEGGRGGVVQRRHRFGRCRILFRGGSQQEEHPAKLLVAGYATGICAVCYE